MFNIEFVDLEKLNVFLLNNNANYANVNNNNYNNNNNSNSLNKTLKRLSKLTNENINHVATNSVAGVANVNSINDLTQNNLINLLRYSNSDMQLNNDLKKTLRSNNWSITHEIRKYLWKCILDSIGNKNGNNNDEQFKIDYYSDLNNIFGQYREIECDLPKFVNYNEDYKHVNYYYLNNNGKLAVKRILCVYAHRYPDVTYCPAIISICSLLLHYMQEYQVYTSICCMFAKKDYLIETKSSWETNCLVFNKLFKAYCVSLFLILFPFFSWYP